MTKEEIIEMAKQSGAMFDHMTWVERDLFPVFERFAKLVEEKKVENMANLADSYRNHDLAAFIRTFGGTL